MFHILLHLLVPLAVALLFYRLYWARAGLILLATMVVDVDHVLADPIYDPQRCSIGFHPLHTTPAIAIYVLAFVGTLLWARTHATREPEGETRVVHLVALGLLIHVALDWTDCVL